MSYRRTPVSRKSSPRSGNRKALDPGLRRGDSFLQRRHPLFSENARQYGNPSRDPRDSRKNLLSGIGRRGLRRFERPDGFASGEGDLEMAPPARRLRRENLPGSGRPGSPPGEAPPGGSGGPFATRAAARFAGGPQRATRSTGCASRVSSRIRLTASIALSSPSLFLRIPPAPRGPLEAAV